MTITLFYDVYNSVSLLLMMYDVVQDEYTSLVIVCIAYPHLVQNIMMN